MRAKPWLNAASEGDGFVGAQAVMTAALGGVLLETSAVEVEGLGAACAFAIAELVAVIGIPEGAGPSHLSFASSGLGALAALGVGLVIWIRFILVGLQAVLVAKRPVFLLAESLFGGLVLFFLLFTAKARADVAALHH
jgi:hypothetical protein